MGQTHDESTQNPAKWLCWEIFMAWRSPARTPLVSEASGARGGSAGRRGGAA
jgi:hypothetical protein